MPLHNDGVINASYTGHWLSVYGQNCVLHNGIGSTEYDRKHRAFPPLNRLTAGLQPIGRISEINKSFFDKEKQRKTDKHEKHNKRLSYRRDSAGRQSLCRSRSFKVTDFRTNRKPVCDFLLVNNTN